MYCHFKESFEADFMQADQTVRQHEKEMRMMKDQVNTFIVGRKYFKSSSPNFLTYNEKEKIRKLYDDDSQKNTEDELSRSFPADPYTISQIIKNRWQPKDTIRVQKHDEAVKKNWEAFKAGKLEVDPMLAKHLKKFATRDFNHLAKPEPYRKIGVQVPTPLSKEFSSIITSCKKYSEPKKDDKSSVYEGVKPLRVRKIESQETRMPDLKPDDEDNNTMLLSGRREFSKRPVTLEEFQKHAPIYKMPEENIQVTKFDEIKAFQPVLVRKEKEEKLALKEENNVVTLKTKAVNNPYDVVRIKENVLIPRKLWKSGKLFKVRDCFYDDDGEFLYRVPGMK